MPSLTHHVEESLFALLGGVWVQRTVVTCLLVPLAVKVIGHDVNEVKVTVTKVKDQG